MGEGETFYQKFLDELGKLDAFLTTRAQGAQSGATGARGRVLALSRHDPDVRRILEAMAFLTARTRWLAVTGLRRAVERLNRGYFDVLVAPMPAMAMIQVVPAAKPVPVVVAKGTGVRLTTASGAVGLFATTRPLTALPLTIQKASARGRQIVLQIQTTTPSYQQKGPLDPLAIYFLGAGGDYRTARAQLQAVTSRFQGATVVLDPTVGPVPCDVTFGAPQIPDPQEENTTEHPLARIRSFFHCPYQELFLNLHLPDPGPGKAWQSATIVINLDENWPMGVPFNEDGLQLFVVPVTNLRPADARPIRCDGTRESYPILGDDPLALGGAALLTGEASALHSVRGVYTTDRGRTPLRSGLLSDDVIWEVETSGDDPDHLDHQLLLKIPGAFQQPKIIAVDARWYQPGFDAVAAGRLRVSIPTQRPDAATLGLAGNLVVHKTSPLWNDPPALLRLMSLRTKVRLEKQEVLDLMALLGADADDPTSLHGVVAGYVAEVDASEEPDVGQWATGVRYVFELTMSPYDPSLQGLVDDFRDKLAALLDAWLPGKVAVSVSGGGSAS